MTSEFCVLLGDVVDSRNIEDREAFHEKLKGALERVNERHESEVYAPLTLLKGIDEIGGVLTAVSPIVAIEREITKVIYPEQIRLAAVVGEIDVNVETRDVSQMDGPAFARADAVLFEIEAADLTFRLSGNDPMLDELISDEINLLNILRESWSERRMEVISTYEEYENQTDAAAALGITKQAVSNHLRESKFEQIQRIEERLVENVQSYPAIGGEST